MKNVLKITFLAAFFALVACGETATQKEATVAPAAATAKTMVEEKAKEVMDKAEMVKDEMAKEGAEKAEMVKEGMEEAKSMAKEGIEKAKTVKDEMTKEAMEKAKTVKDQVTKTTAAAATTANKAVTLKEKPEKVILQKESVIEAAQEKATAAKEKAAATTKEAMPKAETPKVATPAPAPKKVEVKKEVPKAFSHAAWNTLAQKHISSTGKVNYKGFKADIGAFEAYLKSLADNPIQSSWSRGQKMAYWINAYNAFTIKLIVDNYPVKSITDLEGGKPWDKKWIKLGGKTYSLNNIEHDILRPKYKDARIHFAVNCAAKSCPPVWNKAWTAANLNGQLERATKSFINNAKYNSVGGSNAAISKIFEWYAVDFGNITDYLNKYANTKVAGGTAVTYQEYNWALNE